VDLLRIVVKKRSEDSSTSTQDKDSLKRFSTRVAKLRGEGPMASSLEPEVTLEVVSINIRDIEVPANYVRKSVGDVHRLVSSIKAYGIQQPIKVVKVKGSKKFRLVFGSRRLKAAEIAGLDAVPCIVELVTREERLHMLCLAENLHRDALNPLEEGNILKEMQQGGVTMDDLAKNLGISIDNIKEIVELLDLPEAIRTEILLQPHAFTMAILKILLKAFRKSKTIGKNLLKAIGSGSVTTSAQAEAFISAD
jgi:ParB family chromosome partitioning protein